MTRFPARDFNILARNIFVMWAKKSQILQLFDTPGTLKVGQMAPIFDLWWSSHRASPWPYRIWNRSYGYKTCTPGWRNDWMEGWTDGRHSNHLTTSAFGRAKNILSTRTMAKPSSEEIPFCTSYPIKPSIIVYLNWAWHKPIYKSSDTDRPSWFPALPSHSAIFFA
jgi:hypothetical protein